MNFIARVDGSGGEIEKDFRTGTVYVFSIQSGGSIPANVIEKVQWYSELCYRLDHAAEHIDHG